MIGGLVVRLFTALFEGGNSVYQYNLYAADEGEVTVIQSKSSIKTQIVCSSMLPIKLRSLLQTQTIVKRV